MEKELGKWRDSQGSPAPDGKLLKAGLRDHSDPTPSPQTVLEFAVPDPDMGRGKYPGEALDSGGVHHSYKNWLDLAEYFDCCFLTPRQLEDHLVMLRFQPLNRGRNWHQETLGIGDGRLGEDRTMDKKYGKGSHFERIRKLEEPAFLLDFLACLKRVQLKPKARVLGLGVNRGDEFKAFNYAYSSKEIASFRLVGVDISSSAIGLAASRFKEKNFQFIQGDINDLSDLDLGRFDLILSIGTLQSPGIDGHQALRGLIKNHITPNARVIFGFPNCRYLDGELKYGARVKNYCEPEFSLLIRDISFYKRYLIQHKFKVMITGKYYLFLTGCLV